MTLVVIVDDHPTFRQGLRAVLDVEPDIEVVGEFGTGEDAVTAAAEFAPDVVIMDLRMPGRFGTTCPTCSPSCRSATARKRWPAPGTRAWAIRPDKDVTPTPSGQELSPALIEDDKPPPERSLDMTTTPAAPITEPSRQPWAVGFGWRRLLAYCAITSLVASILLQCRSHRVHRLRQHIAELNRDDAVGARSVLEMSGHLSCPLGTLAS